MPHRWLLAVVAAFAMLTARPAQAQEGFDAVIADAKAQMLMDPEKARDRAAAAQRMIEQDPVTTGRETKIATAEWLQGEASLRANDFARAGSFIERALRRLGKAKPSKLLGDLKMSRGGVRQARAEVAAALSDYQSAHNVFRDIGETRSQAIALVTIGILYKDGDDHEAALKYFSRALEVYHGDPGFSISVLNSRGGSLKDLRRYEESRKQYEEALGLARQLDSTLLQAQIYRNIARLKAAQGDLTGADAAIAAGRRLSSDPNSLQMFDAIAAELAVRRKDFREARMLIERSFAGVDLATTDLAAREAHYTAYEIYRELGDQRLALAHLQAMKRLDDQVWKLTASTNTALMAARFDSANQEARIARLKADAAARQLALAQAETRFQQIIFGGVATGAAIVLGLLAFGLWQSRRARIRLSISNVALERALAAKTEFLATTSHEIRTPLNGILGMTQVMLADTRLDAASRDRVGIVHDAGLTMRGLVDDILDMAKMETGNLTVEALPFDLKTMLEDVTRIWGEQARAKGLEFRLELGDCPRGFVGDAGRVRQMVYNLLSNAVKFTAKGSVTLRVACGGGRLTFAVTDTGIGIASEKHGEIFESFKQADGGTTRQFGGTGLGLAIVRNLAAAMDGTVSVDSAPGAGATFTVDLPFVPADIAEPAARASEGLLVVDKNPIARAMLKAVLEPRAGNVTFAGSCAEAAELLGREPVARVLIDEGTARAADDDPFAAIAAVVGASAGPVAVLWSNVADADRAALESAGVALVIAKPIAGPALASALYECNTDDTVITQAA